MLAALLAAGGLAWLLFLRPAPPSRTRLEQTFRQEGRRLLPMSAGAPESRAGTSVRFDRRTLSTHGVYLCEPGAGPAFVYVDAEGAVHRPGRPPVRLSAGGEVLLTPTGTTLFLDGVAQDDDLGGWACHWVATSTVPPERAAHAVPPVSVLDDFMRTAIEDHSYCRVGAGTATLAQHGGGMATSTWQEADANFQRAVNPFSVFTRDGGTVSYLIPGAANWGDVRVEARFYFGLPKTGNVVDINTLPTATDMLVVQGPLDGNQVAFGWCGGVQAFRLLSRQGQAPWTVLGTWDQRRPPLTNWVRIGLALTQGHIAEGVLDDVPVLRAVLPGRIVGPFHIVGGRGPMEFDDVSAWSLPAEAGPGSPLNVRSRSFAGKQSKGSSDPPQFREWANSTGAFLRSRSYDRATQTASAAITTAMPLMGEFSYAAELHSETGGDLPAGRYAFLLVRPRLDDAASGPEPEPLFALSAERTESGWRVEGLPPDAGAEAAGELPELAMARSQATEWRLAVRLGNRWVPVSPPVPGPVHFAIRRSQSGQRLLFSPSPMHHLVHCRNLVHEFFEQAPTDWNWLDGAFRMDCRWACEDQWNFMACGSPALPAMVSKRRFGGDQVHEYFIYHLRLRPAGGRGQRVPADPGAPWLVQPPRPELLLLHGRSEPALGVCGRVRRRRQPRDPTAAPGRGGRQYPRMALPLPDQPRAHGRALELVEIHGQQVWQRGAGPPQRRAAVPLRGPGPHRGRPDRLLECPQRLRAGPLELGGRADRVAAAASVRHRLGGPAMAASPRRHGLSGARPRGPGPDAGDEPHRRRFLRRALAAVGPH
jgi:hypothetical protein